MNDVYETLFNVWSKEKSSKELTALPENLLNELAEYFAQLRRQIKLGDRNSLNTLLKSAELEILQKFLGSLLRIRMRKIVNSALRQEPLENLLPFEKKTFNILQRAIAHHTDMMKNGLNDPRTLQFENEHRNEVVIFLRDFPKFVGEDLNSYGPFKAGDVASINSGNAQALVRKHVVKIIKSV